MKKKNIQSNQEKIFLSFFVVLLLFGFFFFCQFGNNSFLPLKSQGRWIRYPNPAETKGLYSVPIPATFKKRFLIKNPAPSSIQIVAFKSFTAYINGQMIAKSDPIFPWKHETKIENPDALRFGENEIIIEVNNDQGSPVLWGVLKADGLKIETDATWETSWGGATWMQAQDAAGFPRGQRFDPDRVMESPFRAVVSLPGLVLVVATILFFLLLIFFQEKIRGFLVGPGRDISGRYIFFLLSGWALLFVHNSFLLPWFSGFDCSAHLEYIDFILKHGSLPSPTQGWEMYQAPFFYVISAAVLHSLNFLPRTLEGVVAVRMLNLVAGSMMIIYACKSIRLIFPSKIEYQLPASLLIFFLPTNLYLFQYPSNEGVSIMFGTLAVYHCLKILSGLNGAAGIYLLGIYCGLGLLSKSSAIIFVSAIVLILIHRSTKKFLQVKSAKSFFSPVVVIFLSVGLAAPFYWKVWRQYGRLIVGNWDPGTMRDWWLVPGYRTFTDFIHFGEVLKKPLYAGFYGIWNGLYSTLWGDGLCGGARWIPYRPPWNYSFMSLGFLGATIITAFILLGLLHEFHRPRNSRDHGFFALLVIGSLFSMLYMLVRVPGYAQAKSFYVLSSILVPLGVYFSIGLNCVLHFVGRQRWVRIFSYSFLIGLGVNSLISFWVVGGTVPQQVLMGVGWRIEGKPRISEEIFMDLSKRESLTDHDMSLIGDFYVGEIHSPRRVSSSSLSRLDVIRARSIRNEDMAKARTLLERSVRTDPDNLEGQRLLASVYLESGLKTEAAMVFREVLRINPFDEIAHKSLAIYYRSIGDLPKARDHDGWFKLTKATVNRL